MKNAVHNGFGCPNCRSIMAIEPKDEDDDEEDEDDEEEDEYSESEDEDEDEDENEDEEEEREILRHCYKEFTLDDDSQMPDSEYVVKEMIKEGVKIDDFVKFLMVDTIKLLAKGLTYYEYDYRADFVYETFIRIVEKYIDTEKVDHIDNMIADTKKNIKKIDCEEAI
jgi:cobalamin biosynthesis protein CobT